MIPAMAGKERPSGGGDGVGERRKNEDGAEQVYSHKLLLSAMARRRGFPPRTPGMTKAKTNARRQAGGDW